MNDLQLRRITQRAGAYSWSLAIHSHDRPGQPLDPETMNASELMFFFGAPLAHVVQYEDHLKASRNVRAARPLSRCRRVPEFASYQTLSGASAKPGLGYDG
jgi:hypothetical protein